MFGLPALQVTSILIYGFLAVAATGATLLLLGPAVGKLQERGGVLVLVLIAVQPSLLALISFALSTYWPEAKVSQSLHLLRQEQWWFFARWVATWVPAALLHLSLLDRAHVYGRSHWTVSPWGQALPYIPTLLLLPFFLGGPQRLAEGGFPGADGFPHQLSVVALSFVQGLLAFLIWLRVSNFSPSNLPLANRLLPGTGIRLQRPHPGVVVSARLWTITLGGMSLLYLLNDVLLPNIISPAQVSFRFATSSLPHAMLLLAVVQSANNYGLLSRGAKKTVSTYRALFAAAFAVVVSAAIGYQLPPPLSAPAVAAAALACFWGIHLLLEKTNLLPVAAAEIQSGRQQGQGTPQPLTLDEPATGTAKATVFEIDAAANKPARARPGGQTAAAETVPLGQPSPQGAPSADKALDDLLSTLTPRQREVADLALEGFTTPEISDQLYIAEVTVKKHLSEVYRKLEVSGRSELFSLVLQHVSMDN